ncbi:hypothetical protein [Schinkia azotoformans]|uniref:hypothetical protein n=1 Tax=Schinkia azotoformans TaxID=1454 RepID=UPI002DB71C82|nr:hypothetical protein [Schinkia azotoformans]MEC1748077.1 hypothetical protein [Schinkia azotoformans]
MNVQTFAVGETFPLIDSISRGEGTALNYVSDASLFITVKWSNITSKEKKELKNGVIRFRYVKEGEYLLLLMRIGTLPPMEFPFDPTIYVRKGIPFSILSNAINIFAIEHISSKLLVKRLIGMGENFSNFLTETWEKNIASKDFTYDRWLNNLIKGHTTNDLWNKGTPIDWQN